VILVLGVAVCAVVLFQLGPKRQTHGRASLENELQSVVLGHASPLYVDPSGLFSFRPPEGWRRLPPQERYPYLAVFRSPLGADIRVLATPAPKEDFAGLWKRIEAKDIEMGIHTSLELVRFADQRAIQRKVSLEGTALLTIDFVYSNVAHHLQFSSDPRAFPRYLPLIMDLMKTYQPSPAEISH